MSHYYHYYNNTILYNITFIATQNIQRCRPTEHCTRRGVLVYRWQQCLYYGLVLQRRQMYPGMEHVHLWLRPYLFHRSHLWWRYFGKIIA